MNLLKTRTVFAAMFLTILAACSQTVPESPTPTSTVPPAPAMVPPTSTDSPVVTPITTISSSSINGAQSPALSTQAVEGRHIEGLDIVVERFGFALVPEYVPDGIEVSRASLTGRRARLTYGDGEDKLIVTFPVEFSPDGGAVLTRPQDAVLEVEVDDQMGYLMLGGWSDATIQQGPGIDPADAEWDYEKSLTLFYDYQIEDGEDVGIAVQALVNPLDWISEQEIIRIAESLTRVE